MPTPIPFSVPASARTAGFTFTSSAVSKPAGYSTIYWEIDIPIASEYENSANEIDSFLLVNGVDSGSVWKGGRFVSRVGTVDPAPAVQFDVAAVPAGASLQVKVTVKSAMTVGIKNGLIS